MPASVMTRRPALSALRSLPLWAGILAAAVAAFHLLAQIELIDEGVLNMGAWRVVDGQIPFRDFFVFYTPGSFYLVALVYKLFGVALAPGRVVAWLVGVGMIAVTIALSRRIVSSPLFAAIPVAVLCQAGVGGWPFASHHWIADLGCLASAWLVLRALEGRPALHAALSGACASAAVWSLNGQGLLMTAAMALWVIPLVPREIRRTVAVSWAAGWAAVSLPFVVLLAKVPWSTLQYDLFVFPTTAYKSVKGNQYGYLFPYHELADQWTSGAWRGAPVYSAVVTFTSIYLWLAPLAAVALMIVAIVKRWGETTVRTAVLALGTTFVLTVAWRWAPINVQWTAVPPALIVAWALARAHAAAGAAGRRKLTALAAALVAAFGFVGAYRIVKIAGSDAATVRTPVGTWRSFNGKQAAQLQQVVDKIGSTLAPGEPLLCKSVPLVNFMTRHPNPTHLDLFIPPDYTPDVQVQEVIADVEKVKLRYILTPAFVPSETTFDRYLLSHYELDWDNGEFGLWKRTAP